MLMKHDRFGPILSTIIPIPIPPKISPSPNDIIANIESSNFSLGE